MPYQGADYNGIFAGLNSGTYDCIASTGATITPQRQRIAISAHLMSSPAISLVVDPTAIRTCMASPISKAW